MITGVDITYEDLEGEWPEGFEAGPTENRKMKMWLWTRIKICHGPTLRQFTHGGRTTRGSFNHALATCLASL